MTYTARASDLSFGGAVKRLEESAREDALHTVALANFCFAQPVFDLLSKNTEFFVARGAGASDVWSIAIALALLVPAALVGAENLVPNACERG